MLVKEPDKTEKKYLSKHTSRQELSDYNTYDNDMSGISKKELTEVIKYLIQLNEKGLLPEKMFSSLLVATCSKVIEHEVSKRLSSMVNKKLIDTISHLL